jgi:hypothetical protein
MQSGNGRGEVRSDDACTGATRAAQAKTCPAPRRTEWRWLKVMAVVLVFTLIHPAL